MNSKNVRIVWFLLLFGLGIFLSCCSTFTGNARTDTVDIILPPLDFSPSWETVYKGVESFSFSSSNPPFYISGVKIDLSVNEREIVISRGISPMTGENPGKNNFSTGTLEQFMKKEDLIAAINTTPFKPYRLFPGTRQTAEGIVLSEGVLYSMNDRYDAFFITNNKRVILKHPPFIEHDQMNDGAGGFFIILENRRNVAVERPRAARSLLGTSENGTILILAAIDGENTQTGSGATFYEAAEWMRALGAENAINLDGGGSSILGLKRYPEGEITILNHPDGGAWSFFKRNSPVFLGIRYR
ncbi:MAG: phosphodiester glycosidase family protein [Spirochaetia bacterium]|jgi:hypothetical protein|nr:phosphodiester glycosidase family protein [Spirochaetia bacterium]